MQPLFILWLFILASAFAFEVPSTGNPKAARISWDDVSQYSSLFLTETKTLPAVNMGKDMIYHLELEEPSDNDAAMKLAQKSTRETPEVMDATKKKLATLLKNDRTLNVPWQNDAWLVRFLRLRKYDVPKTYKLIKSYYNFKAKNRFIFENLIPSHEREVAEQEVIGVLPNRSPSGSRIFVGQARKWDPTKYSLVQLCRVGILLAETGAYEPRTQLAGVQVIFDVGGLTWQHIRQFNPNIAYLMVQWLLTSAPIKYEGIHIVNQPRIFWTLWNVFKPFLTEELRSKIHFHGRNMKSLHKHIAATALPDLFGGSYPKPSLSSYEWGVVLEAGDKEYKKIESYGIKSRT